MLQEEGTAYMWSSVERYGKFLFESEITAILLDLIVVVVIAILKFSLEHHKSTVKHLAEKDH